MPWVCLLSRHQICLFDRVVLILLVNKVSESSQLDSPDYGTLERLLHEVCICCGTYYGTLIVLDYSVRKIWRLLPRLARCYFTIMKH